MERDSFANSEIKLNRSASRRGNQSDNTVLVNAAMDALTLVVSAYVVLSGAPLDGRTDQMSDIMNIETSKMAP